MVNIMGVEFEDIKVEYPEEYCPKCSKLLIERYDPKLKKTGAFKHCNYCESNFRIDRERKMKDGVKNFINTAVLPQLLKMEKELSEEIKKGILKDTTHHSYSFELEYVQYKISLIPMIEKLTTGKTYSTASGMGGLFDVIYKGIKEGKHFFKVTSPGWTAIEFNYTAEQVNQWIYPEVSYKYHPEVSGK